MSTFTGAVPINQINALPLLSTSQLAFGGTVSVIGGAINRYFSPDVTGINGAAGNMNVADGDPSGVAGIGSNILRSNLLDARGCCRFTVLVGVKMPAIGEDVNYSLTLRIQSPVAADTVAAIPPRTGANGAGAWPRVAVYALQVTGLAAGAFPAYKSSGMGWMVGGRDPSAIQSGGLGFMYLWFNFDNGGAAKSAVMYASMYATS
jgi:hypothetical protein